MIVCRLINCAHLVLFGINIGIILFSAGLHLCLSWTYFIKGKFFEMTLSVVFSVVEMKLVKGKLDFVATSCWFM